VELQDVHHLKIFDEQLAAFDLLVLGVGLSVDAGDVFRGFFARGAAIVATGLETLHTAATTTAAAAALAIATVAAAAAAALAVVALLGPIIAIVALHGAVAATVTAFAATVTTIAVLAAILPLVALLAAIVILGARLLAGIAAAFRSLVSGGLRRRLFRDRLRSGAGLGHRLRLCFFDGCFDFRRGLSGGGSFAGGGSTSTSGSRLGHLIVSPSYRRNM